MPIYLARTTPARWFKLARFLYLAAAVSSAAGAQDLSALVKVYREKPSVSRRSGIERYAAAHAKEQNGALARLALGVTSLEQKDYDRAVKNLKAAAPRLPKLEDYTLYYLASAQLQAQDDANIPRELERFAAVEPLSPLAARATVLRAKALAEARAPLDAIRILREQYDDLPQPDTDLALATAYQAASDLSNAAVYYQRVYYRHPDTDAAERAAAALALLRNSMGEAFPPATAEEMLERGDRWLAAHDYTRARQEFVTLSSQLAGLERDRARVRIGAADYLRGEPAAAARYLDALNLARSEADAERLYYLAECQRKAHDEDERLATVKRLGKQYPDSPWRLKALISAANRYLVENRPDIYEPLYQAAYESFPADSAAPLSHWKVAWNAYLQRRGEAAARLREHLERYPSDPRTGGAMYFLGRLSEANRDFGAARAYYAKIAELYPNYYYAVRARERLADAKLVAVQPSAKVAQYLSGIEFAEHRAEADTEPTATTKLRIERAHLLMAAGFPDLAESELRFGARHDGQANLLAVELARSAASPYLSLRYMKSLAPDYLSTPFEQMPRRFWELLFPMPYQKDLVRNAKLQNLDPYMVAALIRQESEFNPAAVSHKSAYGLTQIMPATGRQLARGSGVRNFRTKMLFQPATNLQLGSRYLRSMLDQWGGKWEETLASYNAGKSRVVEWSGWNSFQEPAEFVESIPFTETREYVQAVLRNAAIYRRLYAAQSAALPSTNGLTAQRNSKKSSATGNHRTAKRNRARAVS